MHPTTHDAAHAALVGMAESAGRQGRPLDVAWTLAGMGTLAGLGERHALHRTLARAWAVGRLAWDEAEHWQAVADADWFDYCAQQAAGL